MTGLEILAGVSAAASLASGVVSAMGAIQQGEATAASAEYNAAVADRNAKLKLAQTAEAESDMARQHRRQMGQIRAAYAQAGVSMQGSPLDVIEDTATEQAFERDQTEYEGRLQAIGLTEKAALFRAEASNARSAGMINAIGYGIGAIDRTSSKFLKPGSAGASLVRA
jgi:hypothetical protein